LIRPTEIGQLARMSGGFCEMALSLRSPVLPEVGISAESLQRRISTTN